MPNISQNNGIKDINKEESLLQDRQKKSKSISKWVKANWKFTIKTRTKNKSFQKQKNARNIEEHI